MAAERLMGSTFSPEASNTRSSVIDMKVFICSVAMEVNSFIALLSSLDSDMVMVVKLF